MKQVVIGALFLLLHAAAGAQNFEANWKKCEALLNAEVLALDVDVKLYENYDSDEVVYAQAFQVDKAGGKTLFRSEVVTLLQTGEHMLTVDKEQKLMFLGEAGQTPAMAATLDSLMQQNQDSVRYMGLNAQGEQYEVFYAEGYIDRALFTFDAQGFPVEIDLFYDQEAYPANNRAQLKYTYSTTVDSDSALMSLNYYVQTQNKTYQPSERFAGYEFITPELIEKAYENQ